MLFAPQYSRDISMDSHDTTPATPRVTPPEPVGPPKLLYDTLTWDIPPRVRTLADDLKAMPIGASAVVPEVKLRRIYGLGKKLRIGIRSSKLSPGLPEGHMRFWRIS